MPKVLATVVLALFVLAACEDSTPTPVPTPTPSCTPAETAYLHELDGGLRSIGAQMGMLGEDWADASANPLLLLDEMWVLGQETALTTLTLHADRMIALTPPGSAQELDERVEATMKQSKEAFQLLSDGITSADADLMLQGTALMTSASDSARYIGIDMDAFCSSSRKLRPTPTPVPTQTPTPRPTPTLAPTATPTATATPTPTPAPTPTLSWMDNCIAYQQAAIKAEANFHVADERLYTEGLCLGERTERERGVDDLTLWMNDFARAYNSVLGMKVVTVSGFTTEPAPLAEGVALARLDFRQRCDDGVGSGYLVGPRDYFIYAERFVEDGEAASERYLPCTLHRNGEIGDVRRADDYGLRWEPD